MQQLILGTGTAIWWLTEPHFCTHVACLYLFALISLLMGQFYMILGCFPSALVTPAYPIHFELLVFHTPDCCAEAVKKIPTLPTNIRLT
jgi:hypothetical protein